MNIPLKKIDAVIVASLIVIAGYFIYKSGYVSESLPEQYFPQPVVQNETVAPPPITPPASFIPSYRRDVSPEDEGVHYDSLRITREWWYFSAVFNDEDSELHNWGVAISFNHMAYGDLMGTLKPDLLTVTLYSDEGEVYGGIVNKRRYLGILNSGTLIASSPGVNVEFENSWAEGEYPDWHVHAEDKDIDTNHDIVIDLDYHAESLPVWTFGTRVFDKSESNLANYLFNGCIVSGTVEIDGIKYSVNGTGSHEHAWSPKVVTKATISGWDWFHITLENGWNVYLSNYYPTPQFITEKLSRINPFGTVLITTTNGETITELKNIDLKITRGDSQIFPFVKMPAEFDIQARPSIKPEYIVSQSFLYGTNTELDINIDVVSAYNKIWKFPTYVAMKVGMCSVDGTLSWSDDEGDHNIPLNGIGITWSMRALL